jgi:hypothetical protein
LTDGETLSATWRCNMALPQGADNQVHNFQVSEVLKVAGTGIS